MVRALSIAQAGAPLRPVEITRRDPGPTDVVIDVAYVGICHSDAYMARDDWGFSAFPMIPGHEVTGTVAAVGADVSAHTVGDRVAAGMLLEWCGDCRHCLAGREQYCVGSGKPADAGGFSRRIVADQDAVHALPSRLDMAGAAPLMCAGITMYSALNHWLVGPGTNVGIVGLGGLGHLGVKLAAAMGARVTVLTRHPAKRHDALRFGATACTTADEAPLGAFDLIISTVPTATNMSPLLALLDVDGTVVMAGAPTQALAAPAGQLITGRRQLAGTSLGSVQETRDMLDFCAVHGITAETEIVTADQINTSFARLETSDVHYRLVLDVTTV
ncbi:NAD(P)-dependent alcohol dehydrogenase [Streptomyces tendae]|uniref:NAD(P)-dependent alcohol dehydrogenase n=1 Tax=Streptomyces tendae TaxID=1932 RepID=UPI00378DF078